MITRFLFILIFFPVFYFPTTIKPNNRIDLLIQLSDEESYKDYLKSFIYAKRACILAEESGTSKQKAEAYYYMARNLIFVGRYNESYSLIKKGMNEEAVKKDKFFLALYKELTSIYYSRLYMLPQEMKENKEALQLVNPHTNPESKLFVSRIYMWIADYYTETHKYDSAQIYIDRSIKLAEEIPEQQYLSFRRMFRRKAYVYFYQAQIYIKQKNTKSALQFIDKAYKQAVSEDHVYLHSILEAYGDYYFLSEEYQNAINYYKKAIQNKKAFLKMSADINLKLSYCYKAMNDPSNEKKYLTISSEQRRYNERISRINVIQIAENILKVENEKKQANRNKNILAVLLVSIVLLLIIACVLYKQRKENRKRNEIIENKNHQLQKTTDSLMEKEKTINILQQKVSELIHMVKANSPHFWSHFQIIFPDFTGKMLKLNPNLRTSELTFSAYLYLGLATKEISQYTFKSVKTIENNRYNLRKKINVPSEKDLSIWINEYIKNTETEA
ncbi:hypothetical protein [Chryseobacterium sp.]|uniref:tetratricopeptide repeat protein n=1 Tax=Chryseobacterium sp. TaxID=1871047 RepID=UPI00261A2942|nr:hypothetical protein [Chryseobacterium sp.]